MDIGPILAEVSDIVHKVGEAQGVVHIRCSSLPAISSILADGLTLQRPSWSSQPRVAVRVRHSSPRGFRPS